MKILFAGYLREGQTSRDRMVALRRLGNDVVEFDLSAFDSPHRLVRSVQSRFHPRLLLGAVNRSLEAAAIRIDGLESLWIEKGVSIFPETIRSIAEKTGCRVIHYTPDSQIVSNRSPHFLESLPLYDWMVTTKSFEVEDYRRLGVRNVLLVHQSYCAERFEHPTVRSEFVHDVGFVSDFKAHYGRIIDRLVEAVPDIGVWGPRWRRAALLHRVPARVVRGDGLWGRDYVDALASFEIGLGLLAKYIPEQHTTRTFEIPAAGTFLLAERTKEHESFFEEGREAEFFGEFEELESKARFYLANESIRKRIAARGRERCRRSGYDNDSVMRSILDRIR